MKTLTVKMPAFLATALVNGDVTGLECRCPGSSPAPGQGKACEGLHAKGCDFYWLKTAQNYCAPGHVVDAGEPYFECSNDLPGWPSGTDVVADYTVLYQDGGES